jgi:hypothetical protein
LPAVPTKRIREQKCIASVNELYDTIAYLDSALFEAFNKQDISVLKEFFSDGLEFYHDLGGVTNYSQNIEAFERPFKRAKIKKELVKGSMESTDKGLRAVETGVHRFFVTEKDQKEKLSSEAKLFIFGRKKNGVWKITRIISYAHRENLE